jgi:hypothetical protein
MIERPFMECFKCWFLITSIYVQLFFKVFIPHDRWVFNLHFNGTFWIVVVSYMISSFLISFIILDEFKEWFINSFVERMIFWSKINNGELSCFLLHFSDSFAISFLIFTVVSFNNVIVESFGGHKSVVWFKIISIPLITKNKLKQRQISLT